MSYCNETPSGPSMADQVIFEEILEGLEEETAAANPFGTPPLDAEVFKGYKVEEEVSFADGRQLETPKNPHESVDSVPLQDKCSEKSKKENLSENSYENENIPERKMATETLLNDEVKEGGYEQNEGVTKATTEITATPATAVVDADIRKIPPPPPKTKPKVAPQKSHTPPKSSTHQSPPSSRTTLYPNLTQLSKPTQPSMLTQPSMVTQPSKLPQPSLGGSKHLQAHKMALSLKFSDIGDSVVN